MKKEKEDIPYRFWKEYEYLDTLKRGDKIKPIAEMIDKLHDLKDKKMRQHALATALQGYFDDILDYIAVSIEKKNKKRG